MFIFVHLNAKLLSIFRKIHLSALNFEHAFNTIINFAKGFLFFSVLTCHYRTDAQMGSYKESNNSCYFLESKKCNLFNFSAVLIFEMRLEANKRSKLLLREKRVSAGAWLTMELKRTDNRVTLRNKLEVSAFLNTTQHIGRVVYVRTAVSLRILSWNEPMQAQHITRISSMGKVRKVYLANCPCATSLKELSLRLKITPYWRNANISWDSF